MTPAGVFISLLALQLLNWQTKSVAAGITMEISEGDGATVVKDHRGRHRGFFYFHTFWCREGDELNSKVMAGFKSLLNTQRRPHLIVWTLPSCLQSILRQTVSLTSFCPSNIALFEVRSTDDLIPILSNSTDPHIRSCSATLAHVARNKNMVAFSDLLRFIALYSFGGIYFDADTFFLRDMSFFRDKAFAFKWDTITTEGAKIGFNTAIMGLPKFSPTVSKVIKNGGVCIPDVFHPARIKDAAGCNALVCEEIIMMPTYFFDSQQTNSEGLRYNIYSWLKEDTNYFFSMEKRYSLANFVPGAYAFHWHNRWDAPIHENSFFAELRDKHLSCNKSQLGDSKGY